ncbi:MAG: hypothetical protein OK439_02150, partial [Thaumarchaeota archaeon]|nr:hypothetical protein [Nitrososphaerota archaeon]
SITLWYANRMLKKAFERSSLRIFADELDSIPPRERSEASRMFEIVGPIVPRAPDERRDVLKEKIVADLWDHQFGIRKLIVVAIGGTSIGKYLIDFLYTNSKEITEKLDCLILILLGPRVERSAYAEDSLDFIRFVGFTPDTLGYFKAADCVVSQAGASTLNEVASVGTPCVAIPIENHFEQKANANGFSEKYRFVVLRYRQLNVKSFVGSVEAAMGKKYVPPDYSKAAEKVAGLILKSAKGA